MGLFDGLKDKMQGAMEAVSSMAGALDGLKEGGIKIGASGSAAKDGYEEIDLYDFSLGNKTGASKWTKGQKFKSKGKLFSKDANFVHVDFLDEPGRVSFRITKRYPPVERGQEVIVKYTFDRPAMVDLDEMEPAAPAGSAVPAPDQVPARNMPTLTPGRYEEIDLYDFSLGNQTGANKWTKGQKFKSKGKFTGKTADFVFVAFLDEPGKVGFRITKRYPPVEKGQEVMVKYTFNRPAFVDLDEMEPAAPAESAAPAPDAASAAPAGSDACPSCGAPLKSGAKFCPECGAKIEPKPTACPSCNAPLAPGAKFCPECGTKV